MSVQRIATVIPASGIYSLATRCNFLLFVTATAPVNLRLENGGSAERFDGIAGGLLVKRIKAWEETRVLGTPGTSIEALIGDELVDDDETDIRLQIATIAGTASFAEAPAASILSGVSTALATGNSIDIPANLLRRRITICNESSGGGPVWVRSTTDTNNGGVELQTGQSVTMSGTYAIRVRNNSGFSTNISFNEEA